jgi:hypothetical protein
MRHRCRRTFGLPEKDCGPQLSIVRNLLGELDVVQDDKGTLDIEHCSVVDAGRNVVVGSDCLNVYL